MALIATEVDTMVTAGYTPSPADWDVGSEPSVEPNGNPVLVVPATWEEQTPTGGGSPIIPTIAVGSTKVEAGGFPVVLSTALVAPPAAVLTLVGARTVEAS